MPIAAEVSIDIVIASDVPIVTAALDGPSADAVDKGEDVGKVLATNSVATDRRLASRPIVSIGDTLFIDSSAATKVHNLSVIAEGQTSANESDFAGFYLGLNADVVKANKSQHEVFTTDAVDMILAADSDAGTRAITSDSVGIFSVNTLQRTTSNSVVISEEQAPLVLKEPATEAGKPMPSAILQNYLHLLLFLQQITLLRSQLL